MDRGVGTVLNKLEELGLADNTIVIFMSDNGGLATSEGSPTSNVPLRGGKGWLYEGGIREPMIIRAPGTTTGGSTCDTPVISMDFYPTILELAGLPLRPRQHVDGRSLVPLLRGRPLDRGPLFWHYPHYGNQGALRPPRSATAIGSSLNGTRMAAVNCSTSARTSGRSTTAPPTCPRRCVNWRQSSTPGDTPWGP